MEDPEEYYDVDDGYDDDDRADEQSSKKVVYPPRLMVDFTSLGMNALLRYAQFYQITVRDDYDKDELAAVVARHFDCSLEVEEDESIVSFMQRIRNGEKAVVRHRPPEKDRKAAKQQQQRKKSNSNSRKRQREAPGAAGAGVGSAGGASGSSSAKDAANGSADAKGAHRGADVDDDAPVAPRPTARSKPSGPPASSGASSSDKSGPSKSSSNGKKSDKGKKDDNGEDNELYCICNLPSYGNMIACDGKKCPNPSQWYHLECVGFSDGRHPDTWLCPECDPKSFAEFKSKKKKNGNKHRSKSPGAK